MKLTRASAYTLKALAYVARQKTTEPIPSHVMAAEARGIPKLFLLKCLLRATSAGLLRSVKGPNGGYRLAKPAEKISMLEILEAVDGPIRGHSPLGEESNGPLNHKLEAICKAAADAVKKSLEKITVAELAGKK